MSETLTHLRVSDADLPRRSRRSVMSTDQTKARDQEQASAQRVAERHGPRRLRVPELLGEDREVILEHGGQDYRLRITVNGKLILTK
jgi:hemin uptake protein HemP